MNVYSLVINVFLEICVMLCLYCASSLSYVQHTLADKPIKHKKKRREKRKPERSERKELSNAPTTLFTVTILSLWSAASTLSLFYDLEETTAVVLWSVRYAHSTWRTHTNVIFSSLVEANRNTG